MARMERRMVRRMRNQAMLRRLLLFMTALVVLAGVASHLTGRPGMSVEGVAQPTATPVAAAFDETITAREITLPAAQWYAIQTGVYAAEEAARSQASAYADRGAPGYTVAEGGKWRVFIAAYATREEAEAVRARLADRQEVETYVYPWPCPEVTLRMSGMAGQLDVAEAGLSLALQVAGQLRDAALAVDQGEMTGEEARTAAADAGERVNLWARTARERFGLPYPEVVEAVLRFCDGWERQSKAIQGAKDLTALAAQLKMEAMACYEEAAALRAGMME